jgi:hypothetical protein
MNTETRKEMERLAGLAKELNLPKGYQSLLDSLAYNTKGGK